MAEKKMSRRLLQHKDIEINEKNTKARGILALVFLAIGVVALAIGVKSCVSGETGWRQISVTNGQMNCSSDFILQYYFPDDDTDLNELNQEVTAIYTQATDQAYKLFYTDAPAGNGGLRDVNDSPNQAVTVNSRLYAAFQQLQEAGDRQIYLAPAFVEYRRVFQAEAEATAKERDPGQNPELMPYISQIAAFANDPAMIDLQLLGNDQVKLYVSPEYLSFAAEYELSVYLDFGWLCNAFISDYIAQDLIDGGYTKGYLSSYDGYTRILDTTDEVYGLNIFDRNGNDIFIPAVMHYTGPASMVFVRNYPLSQQDQWSYYVFSDGKTVNTMLDPADGVCKNSTDNILALSHSSGCAEVALKLSPVYIAQQLDEKALLDLQAEDISCVWFEGNTLKHTGQLDVTLHDDEEVPAYQIQEMN